MPSPTAYTGNATDVHDREAPLHGAPPGSGCSVTEDWAALRERVREANDIVDVVGARVNLRPAGALFKALCPFHDDHNPSMTVDRRRQRYKCWSCGEGGDVFTFVQKFDKVTFPEAMELLARQAGISLEKIQKTPQGPSRAGMFDVMAWAAEQFHQCLLDSPQAETARKYLGERKLTGETVRKFGLGYAPADWDWLVRGAANAGKPADLLETVGLIAKRNEGRGFYDRFRDRVMFPIRDLQGRTVGFGGRILPSSPVSEDRPLAKYINSAETPLFSKSDVIYGLDQARQPASKAGYLAIVEGYTDVLMAHQHGIGQAVATMGTALNARHIKTLRNVASRVVLVFDADAGGDTGVDRALEVFVSNDLDLRIATLPEGLDPCDLLAAQGPEPFRLALERAIDVFEYKLQRVWTKYAALGIDGQRQAAEEMLAILALSPTERSVKLELMVNRIAHRLQIKEETVWKRLKELHARTKEGAARTSSSSAANRPQEAAAEESPSAEEPKMVPLPHERELVELLLAEPTIVERAASEIAPEEMEHPRLRKVLEALYRLHAEGQPADLDHLHGRIDNERLWQRVLDLQARGLDYPDRPLVFQKVLERFRQRRLARQKQTLLNQLQAAADDATKRDLLRQYQEICKLV